MSVAPATRQTRQAWLAWTIAIVVYVTSVFHRSVLGVAGLEAAHRFGVGPAALSTFTVLQVAVYAGMQIPTGLLVDRFGPRMTLTCAALLLGIGETAFGLAHSYPLALLARAVLGVGDAMTWVSVLRVVAARFPASSYPLVVSLSSMLGGFGNLAATVPLTLVLGAAGWTRTFVIAGLLSAGYAAVVATGLRGGPRPLPAAGPVTAPIGLRDVLRGVRTAWRVPGTRLGFWVHFATMVSPTTLGLLWGFPYLVNAQHLSTLRADDVLATLVLVGLVANPIVGAVTSRRREARLPIVVGALLAAMVTWVVLLADPHPLPFGVLLVAFALFAVGGPVSGVGFALARDYNPLHRVGTATGVVNVGGFVATTVAALAVGLLVGAFGPAESAQAYRVGLLAVLAVALLGSWRVAVWWRRARAEVFAAAHRGEQVPVRLRRRRWDTLAVPVPVAEEISVAEAV
ncbi:MAG TPA: MFS transporter [Pseudonocardiaceae bacterium]|nr:MFS transporter [Pseudonocardiaceae bacterium]